MRLLGKLAAWAFALGVLFSALPVAADGPFGGTGDEGLFEIFEAEFAEFLIRVLVWFEAGNPAVVKLVFLAAQVVGGAVGFTAIYAMPKVGVCRDWLWRMPVVMTLAGIAISLGALRNLLAFCANAIEILCPNPMNCGLSGSALIELANYGFFALGFLLAAALTLFMSKRRMRRLAR